MNRMNSRGIRVVSALALLYGFASLVHHVHNTLYLADYPNMPEWLTPLRVMLAWAFVAGVGVLGGGLLYHRFESAGLIVLGVFAGLGFCGLDHFAIAKMSEHTFWMNFTILFEVGAAFLLLNAVAFHLPRLMRNDESGKCAT